jgi:hypothetical protein
MLAGAGLWRRVRSRETIKPLAFSRLMAAALPAKTEPLDRGVERYRSFLVAEIALAIPTLEDAAQ